MAHRRTLVTNLVGVSMAVTVACLLAIAALAVRAPEPTVPAGAPTAEPGGASSTPAVSSHRDRGTGPGRQSVSGTIYRDLDSDGQRDLGEPGVPGVDVGKLGTPIATRTDAGGQYALKVPVGTHQISVVTGWLRSGCPGDLHCDPGPGPQQDFASLNQFYRAEVFVAAGEHVDGVDGGFLPDHGDPAGSPGSGNGGNDAADGPAAGIDLAVRHSMAGDRFRQCADPALTRVCDVGDAFATNAQIYNQGTLTADDVRFIVTIPRGTRFVAGPLPNPTTRARTAQATGRGGQLDDGSRWVEYKLDNPLPAAGAAYFTLRWEITTGPSSPVPYANGLDRDRKSFLKVSGVESDFSDPDSRYGVDPRQDRNGGHNVNWQRSRDEDSMDTIEWNVR